VDACLRGQGGRDGGINGVIRIPRAQYASRASAFLPLRGGHHFQDSGSLVNQEPGSARDACGLFALKKGRETKKRGKRKGEGERKKKGKIKRNLGELCPTFLTGRWIRAYSTLLSPPRRAAFCPLLSLCASPPLKRA